MEEARKGACREWQRLGDVLLYVCLKAGKGGQAVRGRGQAGSGGERRGTRSKIRDTVTDIGEGSLEAARNWRGKEHKGRRKTMDDNNERRNIREGGEKK